MLSVLIRPAHPEEAQELRALLALSLRSLCSKHYTPEQIEILVQHQGQHLFHRLSTLFVAEHDEKIVGFASINLQTQFIEAVFVHPNFARQRVGSQLVIALETEARRRHCPRLMVFASLAAVSFYQSLGYVLKRETQLQGLSLPIEVALMSKQLLVTSIAEQVMPYLWVNVPFFLVWLWSYWSR
jgi:putative acetyltransferase